MLINQHKQERFIQGVSLYQNYQYHNAAEEFLSCMEEQLDGRHEFVVINHGQCQEGKGSHGECHQSKINELVNKQRLICGSYQALLNLSCCCIKQNQFKKAYNLCYRALQFNPYGSLAYYNLSIVHIRAGNYPQALNQMRCALSCEYLRSYQRTFSKHYLDNAISLSPNNLHAIKYRLVVNGNFLQFITHSSMRCSKLQEEEVSIQSQEEVFTQDGQQSVRVDRVMNQLKQDVQALRMFNRTYQVQLNTTQPSVFISAVKPQFFLNSKHHTSNQNAQHYNNLQSRLELLHQLKSTREEYIKLLQQNQSQLQISDVIDMRFTGDYEAILVESAKIKGNRRLTKSRFSGTDCCQQVLETSFELEDSCSIIKTGKEYQDHQQRQQYHQDQFSHQQVSQVFKRTNKSKVKNINNKQNQMENQNEKENQDQKENKKINNTEKQYRQSPLSNCNRLMNPNPKALTQNPPLAQSAISIQDYSQTHQDNTNTNNETPQYTVNLIQSVLLPSTNENQQSQSSELFQIQQNAKFQSFAQNRNKSSESIICSLLSPMRDLQRSQYHHRKVNNSRMLQSKSFFKQLACSKCSVDHDNSENFHQKKNVKMQINLTEIYNYDCNFTEIQSFCVIKHNGQELRTEVSKGKFPNWKDELKIHVDFEELNDAKNDNKNAHQSQSNKIKIQLWAKPTHFKKDPYLNPNCILQLIGEQIIDLREQKWVKRKIMLENNLQSQQRKKTAYMYISLQKIKHKKL